MPAAPFIYILLNILSRLVLSITDILFTIVLSVSGSMSVTDRATETASDEPVRSVPCPGIDVSGERWIWNPESNLQKNNLDERRGNVQANKAPTPEASHTSEVSQPHTHDATTFGLFDDIQPASSPTRVPHNTPTKPKLKLKPAKWPVNSALRYNSPSSVLDSDAEVDTDSFNFSLLSDTCSSLGDSTLDDESLCTVDGDDSFSGIVVNNPNTPSNTSAPILLGLGILGLCKKDGAAFDGTGIVGISNNYPAFALDSSFGEDENEYATRSHNLRTGARKPTGMLLEEIRLTFLSSPPRTSGNPRHVQIREDGFVGTDLMEGCSTSSPVHSRRRLTRDLCTSTISSQLKSTTKIDKSLAPVWRA